MFRVLRNLLAGLLIMICVAQLALAQVTFTRGSDPVNRAAPYDNVCSRITAKSLALTLHTLMAEMKHLMACDRCATVNYSRTLKC